MHLVWQVLDRRHKGHGTFVRRVQVLGSSTDKVKNFNQLRVWCWETFGPSCERDSYCSAGMTSKWAWHIDDDYYSPFIYLSNSETESLFKLKWA